MKKALLIIDMQNDFMPEGALPVAGGRAIISHINQIMENFDCVIATQDYHPHTHASFTAHDGPWPSHCVQGEKGAELVSTLDPKPITMILRKGIDPLCDSYSAFFDAKGRTTGLSSYLKSLGVTELHVVGVATDVCVYFTVMDALKEGFFVCVDRLGCAGLDGEEKALKEMALAGAELR